MASIQSITHRTVLNSHVKFTTEFIVTLQDGSQGKAAPSQGETISIYEDRKVSIDPQAIIETLTQDGLLGKDLDQAEFDAYLQQHIGQFGRNNAFGLSEAFFDATCQTQPAFELFGRPRTKLTPPRISLNILNEVGS